MSSLKRIVAAVDGSVTAARGLRFAIERAKCHGAAIDVAYAVNRVGVAIATANPYGYVDPTPMLDAIDDRADAFLEEGVTLAETFDVSAAGTKLEGSPADAIVERVNNTHADAVVVGTHGRTGIRRLVIGSVAEGVVTKCTSPVFVVPQEEPTPAGPLRRALVCIDGSAASEMALAFAVRIAAVEKTQLTLCTVAEAELPREAMRIETLPIPVEYQLLHGDAVTEITSFADAISADCIFAGTHGRTGISRFMLGSVASGLLQLSRVPVCTVRHE
ncbi:MAG TPA: universal stress protein [Candidatus Baltobacteraceae bacterium]|nr:universal stress protein [Candidatus Baltobacteraceae bacterium]